MLVVGQQAAQSAIRAEGMALGFVGVLGLVSGTIWFRLFCREVPALPGATAQFLAASAVGWVGMVLFERPEADVDLEHGCLGGVEYVCRVAGRDGALFLHAGAWAGSSDDGKFLPGAGDGGDPGLGAAGGELSVLAVMGFVVAGVGCWMVSGAAAR